MLTMDMPVLANFLGFLALISYIVTVLPTILKIVFPVTKVTKIPQNLLKHRRLIGILAFFFTIGHAFLLISKRDVDFFDFKTYSVYFQGLSTFAIFTILAATSNDWSVKKLKADWKKLHKLTYLAMFLLTWHIWGKMLGHWTYLTPIGIVFILVTTVSFMIRIWIETRASKQNKLN